MTTETKSTPVRKRRQTNSSGKASREQILIAAEGLLRKDGYHTLSTRKVADACGISVGNLTYHFPNKIHLVEALMLRVCERYEQERANIKLNCSQSGPAYLKKVIGWILDDAVTPDTSDLFLELWVLAKHHDFGEAIVERFYQTTASWIEKSLAQYFPEAPPKKRKCAAYFMLTLSEGTVALFSLDGDQGITQKDMVEFAVNGVLSTLKANQ
jgi:AcrR family transcriptional regulator